MTEAEWIAELRAAGLLTGAEARIRPISGGVSSEINLVEQGGRRFVVKEALDRLKVADEWLADRCRNRAEQDYFKYVGGILPGVVPRILHAEPDKGWFAMEFIDGEMKNWKAELLAGRIDPSAAVRAGEALGRIHRASWGDPKVAARFDTLESFTQLRISPYLLTTADRVPDLAGLLRAEAERLGRTRLALVHGDYSPKNILIAPNRLAILDAEVAWYGEPAFDMGFLLNHFHLKALYHNGRARSPSAPRETPSYLQALNLAPLAWDAYSAALGPLDPELESRTVRLVLCLLLARIHGKSPVEYLMEEDSRRRATEFVRRQLPRPPSTVRKLADRWAAALAAPAS